MHGQVDYKKVLDFHGLYFRFAKPITMNIMGKERTSTPNPLSVNEQPIYRSDYEVNTNPLIQGYSSLKTYMAKAMQPVYAKLPDGVYIINTNSIVISKKGKLVYFDYSLVRKSSGKIHRIGGSNMSMEQMRTELERPEDTKVENPADTVMAPDMKKMIHQALYKALDNAPAFKPALKNGKPVNCLLGPYYYYGVFVTVKDGKVKVEDANNMPPPPPKTGNTDHLNILE